MKKSERCSLIATAEFTLSHPLIVTRVNVCSTDGKHRKDGAIALWDTGSEHCGVSKALAQELGLLQVGTRLTRYGDKQVIEEPTYLVNIEIPQTGFKRSLLVVGFGDDSQDFIIGMPLIRTGIFHIEPKPDGGFRFVFMKRE